MQNLKLISEYNLTGNSIPHYFPLDSRFQSLLAEFSFRLEDLIVFHSFVYHTYNINLKEIKKIAANAPKYDPNSLDDEDYEMALVSQARHRERVGYYDDLNQKASFIANDSVVINLWAIIEQFSARAYSLLESIIEGIPQDEVKVPFRWDQLTSKYLSHSVDLEKLDSYDVINESRVLNNKIKHLYMVDESLAAFPFFNGKEKRSLSGMEYRLQDYIIGTHKFIGHLLEVSAKNLGSKADMM
ncbi:TPA: hypothetical protein ACPYUI_000597 [Raoultella ornithinolytica]|uniref:hypothetical protein n=1 Tax=Raoultella ornithinolytica TaxID=54291 RepID=UPI0015DD2E5A|nr:hypothetical protein [Raoultella ornithinolytica]EJD6650824.1 hypothetical protein [Raoultella ornithinolytica]ELV3661496.1 hypothetical protein [Raoultella ornithinolytica]MEB7958261.1 hypothetical protein [Raoultella ornithinolytica]BBJ86490.1 hypothetical protein ROGSH02058M1_026890 [Raoultella ornithinolytica]BBT85434.1 hypothetical protein WP8W19C01_26750 [Raoultella ornithinolytica]